ncbi:AGAP012532-PA, partial [Anopheles gambiae str. PEST]
CIYTTLITSPPEHSSPQLSLQCKRLAKGFYPWGSSRCFDSPTVVASSRSEHRACCSSHRSGPLAELPFGVTSCILLPNQLVLARCCFCPPSKKVRFI